ncbi:uncharacterized protein LOC101864576 [Aplysia californica]|uniref:Uncharacterized protein LOC101864576 n=1 Tax=Aplysia californica TaxID=6500 RepID=A0ABM1ADB3_APLCA|nr:uncharacterized protein LOC101864576 [Aplysia californica]
MYLDKNSPEYQYATKGHRIPLLFNYDLDSEMADVAQAETKRKSSLGKRSHTAKTPGTRKKKSKLQVVSTGKERITLTIARVKTASESDLENLNKTDLENVNKTDLENVNKTDSENVNEIDLGNVSASTQKDEEQEAEMMAQPILEDIASTDNSECTFVFLNYDQQFLNTQQEERRAPKRSLKEEAQTEPPEKKMRELSYESIESNIFPKDELTVFRQICEAHYLRSPHLSSSFLDFDANEFEEMTEKLFGESLFDNSESEGELLPDEPTVDLAKMMDYHDVTLDFSPSMLLCEADCNNCKEKIEKAPQLKDPFMGSTVDRSLNDGGSSAGASMLGQIMCPLEEQNAQQQTPQPEVFSAWSHTSNTDEYHVFTKSSFSGLDYPEDDEPEGLTFPDTSSTYSDSGLPGDDSDVDIETVTETPRSCGEYSSSASPSTTPSPSSSPKKDNFLKISKLISQSTSSKSLLRVNSSQGVSSSASLAENLMAGRSNTISGQKRKLQKEKKSSKSPQQQSAPTHVLANSNSVNFHDYAMSPGSNLSLTETGRPTVMAKRTHSRKRMANNIDISDKEKQHHHNQLERNRRQKLADLFAVLRVELPKIRHHAKASKVMVLNEGTNYIKELRRLDSQQTDEIESLVQKRLHLEKQLRLLEAQRS